MQELEKILEEIKESSIIVATSKEHYIHPQDGKYVEEVVLLDCVEEIIRKHLSRENIPEITRYSRDNKYGEGSRKKWYMKEYENALKEDGVSEAFLEDCKCVAQKYKKDNGEWIPVKERLPIPNKEVWVIVKRNGKVFTSTDGMTENRHFWNYEKENILAWKEKEAIPDPYRPERSRENEK